MTPLAGTFFLCFLVLSVVSEVGKRSKRQILCRAPCFQCSPRLMCQNTYPLYTCNNVCCCPAQRSLTGACDGEDSVAACLNNLCGQGFFCNRNQYCCRCPTGKSIGNCVNGKCPAGYACNTNNYCCAVGMIGTLGPCINGQCPAGYTCGEGNMCYATGGTTPNTANAFNGTSNSINAFTAFSALSRAEPTQSNSGGLSSFQLASLESNKDSNFGSSSPNMHSYVPENLYENPYVQNNAYNSFGSSAPINFFQQQAINQAFQSQMLNPFLSAQSFKRKN